MMKKILLASLLVFMGLPACLYLSLPFSDIKKLKYGHPVIKRVGAIKNYQILKKRPPGWTELGKVNKTAYLAIVVSEDWAFYQHDGFDINQISQAFTQAVSGERVRGASTISQQVVKNIFLTNEKSISRKLKEVLLTYYLEREVSKNKILEIYLNIIEYGKNLYGITKATNYYFEKKPIHLNVAEGAFLAMLLPSPIRYAQSFRKKELTTYASTTVEQILDKMVQAKHLKRAQRGEYRNYHYNFIEYDDLFYDSISVEQAGVKLLEEDILRE